MFRLLITALLALCPLAVAASQCGTVNLMDELTPEERELIQSRAAALPFHEGALFRATKDGHETIVVGTVHIPDPRLDDIVEDLTDAVETADLMVLELTKEEEAAMATAAAETPGRFFLTDGPTLIDLLGEEDWATVAERLESIGIPAFVGAKFKPWYMSLMLSVPPCVHQAVATGEKGLDRQLEAIAEASDVPKGSLDDPDVIFQIFGSAPLDEQIEALRFSLETDVNGEEMMSTLLAGYFEGRMAETWELSRLMAETEDGGIWADQFAEMEEDILFARNRAWEPILIDLIEGKNAVVAVGAAHLPGETGVLRSLERAGYDVTAF